ncbi:uncharacterized protein FYW61_003639 isoform 2-T2 [Anableps anableps]
MFCVEVYKPRYSSDQIQRHYLSQHFPDGKPTDRFPDPVSADPIGSKTCKAARLRRAPGPISKAPASKRRKNLNNKSRSTQNDHHTQEGTSDAAAKASAPEDSALDMLALLAENKSLKEQLKAEQESYARTMSDQVLRSEELQRENTRLQEELRGRKQALNPAESVMTSGGFMTASTWAHSPEERKQNPPKMFPKDRERRKRWETAARSEGFSASRSSTLCSEHFRPEDVDRTGQIVRIRDGAVPSVFHFPAHLQKAVATRKAQDRPQLVQEADPLPGPKVVSVVEMAETKCPQPIKEEHTELWVFQDEGQLVVKQETSTSLETPAKKISHNVPEPAQITEVKEETEPLQIKEEPEPVEIKEEQEDLCVYKDEEQIEVKQEPETFMVSPTTEQKDNSEPTQNQLLSANRPEAENQHHQRRNQKDSEPETRPQDGGNRRVNVDNSELRCKTGEGEKPSSSDGCDESDQFGNNLAPHTGGKPFSCPMCGKCFYWQSELNTHVKRHTEEKRFSCDVCHKSFVRKSGLACHLRVHTGEKPYPCEMCDKSFRQRGTLNIHLRTHTGEKPFSCLTCGKRCITSSALTVHMRTHTKPRSYFCEVCGKSFKHSINLLYHYRIHQL